LESAVRISVVRDGAFPGASGADSCAESFAGSFFVVRLPSFAERRLLVAMR
jgi:hypothetical protein